MGRYVCIGGPADGEWHDAPLERVERHETVSIAPHLPPSPPLPTTAPIPGDRRTFSPYRPVPIEPGGGQPTLYVLVAFDPNLSDHHYPHRAMTSLIRNYRPRKESRR